MDTVLNGTVAAHVVDNASPGNDQTVCALFNALIVLIYAMRLWQHLTFLCNLGNLPQAAQIRCPGNKRICASVQDGFGEGLAISTSRRVCYRDVIYM